MRELFVYYRIREGAVTSARAAIVAMHDELRRLHPGLVARLLKRDDENGATTLMETYAMATGEGSAGVDATIEKAIAAHAARLTPFIDGARHVEAFDSDA